MLESYNNVILKETISMEMTIFSRRRGGAGDGSFLVKVGQAGRKNINAL